MKKLAIIGAGALGQHLAHYATTDGHYEMAGYFDDFQPVGARVAGAVVLGGVPEVPHLFAAGAFDEVLIGVGYRHMAFRQQLAESLTGHVPLGRLVHSSAFVDPTCQLGAGVCVFPGCVIDRQAVVLDNVLLNLSCTIAHDAVVGRHSFLSGRVMVAGGATIGTGCFIGISTTIIDHVTLGDRVQTGGGTVVTRSLTQPGLYVGVPARFVR